MNRGEYKILFNWNHLDWIFIMPDNWRKGIKGTHLCPRCGDTYDRFMENKSV